MQAVNNQIIVYRLDNGVIGELRGNGLGTAKEMLGDNYDCGNGALNRTRIYNEIEINSKDFVPY